MSDLCQNLEYLADMIVAAATSSMIGEDKVREWSSRSVTRARSQINPEPRMIQYSCITNSRDFSIRSVLW